MSQDPESLDWVRLTRYLSGDLSPAESAVVERWFGADPEHRALLDELRAVWTATGGEVAGWDTEGAIDGLRRRVTRAAERRPAPVFAVVRRRSWVAIAAGLGAIAVGAGVVLTRKSPAAAPVAVATPTLTDVTTRRAQQAEVRLPDGTRVILGPASRLSYPTTFGQSDRTVVLDGEAYFTVAHNTAKPFRVRSKHGFAEDIGTAFVMRARGESMLQVVVVEGSVVLRPTAGSSVRRDTLLLTPGQLGRILPDGSLVFRSRADTVAYLAWTRGRLVFDDTPLADVAAELSRWYDADVRVAGSRVGNRRFSGRFERRSLDEAVRLVAAVTDLTVRRTGGAWVFE